MQSIESCEVFCIKLESVCLDKRKRVIRLGVYVDANNVETRLGIAHTSATSAAE